ncbi:hypothetical protein LguiA_004801 [Lonicera macranthoides]
MLERCGLRMDSQSASNSGFDTYTSPSVSSGNQLESPPLQDQPQSQDNQTQGAGDEGEMSTIGGTKRKKGPERSVAWQHCKKQKYKDDEGKEWTVGVCNYCQLHIPADSKRNGTTGLLNHLHRCEGSPLRVGVDKNQPMLTQSSMGGLGFSFDQTRLDFKCVKWIIKAEMPFRVVDHLDFKDFIHDLQPRYIIPNRKKVANEVWSMFCEEKAKIKSIIGDVRVSVTTDTWTSIQNINYMVVTAHFIDSEFKLHKRVVNFCKITSHKGDDIGRCLEEKLNEWGVSKVFSITVDNASSNDVAVEYLKKQFRKHDNLLLDGYHLHMRCTCHIINLIVKDGMKELVESIEGIRNCVKFIHSSSARLDKFRECAILEKKDKMATVPMDVVTRWNATYTMLHSAYKFKDVFARLADDSAQFVAYFCEEVVREVDGNKVYAKRVGPPNDVDWEKAMGFTHFLKKFYDATIKLSATKTPTSHLVLKILINLKLEIDAKIRDHNNPILQNVATSMKRKFDKYWGSFEDVNLIMFVAQALDPRYKFQMIELHLEDLGYPPNRVEDVKTRVKSHLNLMYEAYKGTNVERSYVEVRVEEDDDQVDDVEARVERRLNRQRREAKLKEIANEVDKYFNDAYESTRNDDFDLLEWWRVNSGHYPTLAKVAKDVFAIPSSTVASENAFSLGGRIVDPFRASLTPRMVEALVCTSDWLKGDEFQFYKEPTEDEIEFYKELEELEKSLPNVVEMSQPPPPQAKMPHPPVQELPPRPPSRGGSFRGRARGRSNRGRSTSPSSTLSS